MAELLAFSPVRARAPAAEQYSRPALPARQVAERLGVTELELAALRCGADAVRLDPAAVLADTLASLGGFLLALRAGASSLVVRQGAPGSRAAWRMPTENGEVAGLRVFATVETLPAGPRRALLVFTPEGEALFRVYLDAHSNHGAWRALVDSHRCADQSPWEQLEAGRPDGRETACAAHARPLPGCCVSLLLRHLRIARMRLEFSVVRSVSADPAAVVIGQSVEGWLDGLWLDAGGCRVKGAGFESDLRALGAGVFLLSASCGGPALEIRPAGGRGVLRIAPAPGRVERAVFCAALAMSSGLDPGGERPG